MFNTALLVSKLGYEIPLVITAKESPEFKVTAKDFEVFSKNINATFINTSKINTTEVKDILKSIGKIDIAVSINYSGVISQEIIDFFEIGILNAHGGDLPRYRGNACQAWAIINGEDSIGLCIHKMVGGELDSGDIINREYLPIDINTKIGEVYEWMNNSIPDMIAESIKKLTEDVAYFLAQQSKDPKDALRCYPRTPGDGEINWNNSNVDILRLINASGEPFSGAYSTYNGSKLIIWRAELYEDNERYLSTSGQIASINKEGFIIVITGRGKLKITEIEYEGHRTVKINEVIKSIRIKLK